MAARIITLQRQARELGRLRAGTYVPPTNGKRGFPQRSRFWILTSHQREYLNTAAELWGGTVEPWTPQGAKDRAWRLVTETEAVDAILPAGDPLSQSYEMWSRGGCQRRCDGETEQMSNKPCICRIEFGEEFYNNPDAVDSRGTPLVCKPHTRLNVILPDLPDLGVWRMESKGFYAANEIPAAVDLIYHATGGKVVVPVRLRIEPRKRVAQGKTKNFPVIVMEIRGATAGQILSGQPQAVASADGSRAAVGDGGHAQALTAAEEFTAAKALAAIAAAATQADLNLVRWNCQQAGLRDQQVVDAWSARSNQIEPPTDDGSPSGGGETDAEPPVEDAVEGEVEPDPDATWSQINAYVGKNQQWSADVLEQRVIGLLGKSSIDANGFELDRFLTALKAGRFA